ncbi:branched-chain amino acid ABC transporter permease [Chloroflexota bacterium]
MNIIHKLGGWAPLAVITVILATLPFMGLPRSWIPYLFLFFIYFAMTNMWNLLAGYSGLVSLCQHGFIGLAGYSLAIFSWYGLPFYLGIIAGIVVVGIFAMLISFPIFRLRGIYFAVGTLVVPEAMRLVFLLWKPAGVGGPLQGGGAGYTILGTTAISTTQAYWMALFVALASILIVRIILRSKLGIGLKAIRDSERTANASGVNILNTKICIFIIGAVITGLAGAIFYASQQYIEPYSAFNLKWTMMLILATIIGGMGTQAGPVVGTAIIIAMYFGLAKYGSTSLLLQGVILIGVMLALPRGIMGYSGKIREMSSRLIKKK